MSTPPVDPPLVGIDPEQEPARVSGWFIAVYTVTHFGLYLTMMMPALFSLAYKVQVIDPAGKESSLGLIVGIGGIVGLVAGPIAGTLSDRTRLAWGRRRPFLVAGVVILAVGALVIAAAPSVGMMLVGFIIAQLGLACSTAALNPVVAEWVPESQRGKVGAFAGVASAFAGVAAVVVGSLLTSSMWLLFLVPVVVFAITAALFLVAVPDRPAHADIATGSVLHVFKDLLFNPRKHPDFALVWAGKFFLQTGLAFFSTYQLYFLLDRLGLAPEDAGQQLALVGGLGVLAMTGSAIAGGFISDRVGRRKPPIYVASALVITGLIILAFASSVPLFAVGALFMLAGTGAFNSVDVALASDVLPDKEQAGKYMSIYYLAAGAPGAIEPVFAPVILAIGGGGNYTALFLTGALFAMGAIATVWRVRAAR
jgi:MFS family permease